MENKKLLPISIIILAVSILVSSVLIVNSFPKTENKKSMPLEDKKVLTLSQAAEYMNMTEKEILEIIRVEQTQLEKAHVFTGRMFPYFAIDNKKYFYKNELEEWVKEASINRREYDTKQGWIKK